MPHKMRITRIAALRPGMRVSGTVGSCRQCGVEFIGRSDAQFCGNTCRVAFSRAQAKAETERADTTG